MWSGWVSFDSTTSLRILVGNNPKSDFQIFTWFIRVGVLSAPMLSIFPWTFSLQISPVMLLLLWAISPVIFLTPTTVFKTREPPELIPWRGAMTTSESTRGVAHGPQPSFFGTGPVGPTLVLPLLTSLRPEVLSSTLIPPVFCLVCCCCCSPLPAALPRPVRLARVFHIYLW